MPRTALFPGSFDPVTNGHLDLVQQSVRIADRLVLAIGTHPGKTPLFSVEERLAMLADTCAPVARAASCDFACTTFADLVVLAAKREGATLLIRGLRSATDGEFRRQSYIIDFFRKALGPGGVSAEKGEFFHRNDKGETIPIEKLVVHAKASWSGPIFADHFAFLK